MERAVLFVVAVSGSVFAAPLEVSQNHTAVRMETLNPHNPEDVPDCGVKPLSLKEWLIKTRGWDDEQFRQDLNFNRGDGECGDKRISADGAVFANSDCLEHKRLPENMRDCTNRTGGENMTFFMNWFLFPEHFTVRQWRAIESVFYHHPQALVTVVSNTLEESMFAPLTARGCAVVLEKVHPKVWAANTPMASWSSNIDEWKHGPHFFEHLRDAVALMLLYSRGGVYFESDTIFTNSVSHLRNSIGEGSLNALRPVPVPVQGSNGTLPPLLSVPAAHLTTSVMAFDKESPFVAAVMKGFASWYEAELSKDMAVGHGYGAWVATRVWNETFSLSRSSPSFTVLSPHAFNLLSEGEVAKFFVGSRHELVDNDFEIIESRAYAVRLWGESTRTERVMEGSLAYRLLTAYCLRCDMHVT